MAGEGKLCYKPNDGRLVFKRGGDGSLVFKVTPGDWTQISFAWGSDGNDLDICAYWDGTDMKFGYGYNTGTSEYVYPDVDKGPYHVLYSGDIRDVGQTEWLKLKNTPWSLGARTFKVHFNYFGYDSEHSANTCTVIASQMGGDTFMKREQPCSTTAGRKAIGGSGPDADPYCVVSFDETGKLIGVQ